MYKTPQILENIVRCEYFEVGVHIKNPIKNSYQDGLGNMTQTLDHVVVVHILIWDRTKSHINEYSDLFTRDKNTKQILYHHFLLCILHEFQTTHLA